MKGYGVDRCPSDCHTTPITDTTMAVMELPTPKALATTTVLQSENENSLYDVNAIHNENLQPVILPFIFL